jgi:hypothetical protein
MAIVASDLAAIMKILYPNKVIDLDKIGSPTLVFLMKNHKKDASIDYNQINTQYGAPPGVSGTFATAQSNAGASSQAKFTVGLKDYYGIGQFDRKLMMQSKHKGSVVIDAVKNEINTTAEAVGRNIAHDMLRTRTRVRGVVSSGGGGTALVLTDNESRFFWKGQKIVASSAAAGAAAEGAAVTVSAINHDTNTLTVSGATTGPYLFTEGDLDASGTGVGIDGLEGWAPSSAPSDTWNGQSRAADTRLGGLRVTSTEASGRSRVEIIKLGGVKMFRSAVKPEYVFVSPEQFDAIDTEIGDQKRYTQDKALVGFEVIVINTPGGPVKVVADPFSKTEVGFIVGSSENFETLSLGDAPHIQKENGAMQVLPTADGAETRISAYVNLGVKNTCAVCYIPLPTV